MKQVYTFRNHENNPQTGFTLSNQTTVFEILPLGKIVGSKFFLNEFEFVITKEFMESSQDEWIEMNSFDNGAIIATENIIYCCKSTYSKWNDEIDIGNNYFWDLFSHNHWDLHKNEILRFNR